MTITSAPLSSTQGRIAQLLVDGRTNEEIADAVGLSTETVRVQIHKLRLNVHCPPRSSRPYLAHALLRHGKAKPPQLPARRKRFAPDADGLLLLRALAEHPGRADIARAAGLTLADLAYRTERLVNSASASSATHLIGIGYALELLGPAATAAAGTPARPVEVLR
ncbi:LuxR C-terminal-related transcriptional regulator [Streptomyces sp. 5.8]